MNDTTAIETDSSTGILADNGVVYVRGRVSGGCEVYDVFLCADNRKFATVFNFVDAQRLANDLARKV